MTIVLLCQIMALLFAFQLILLSFLIIRKMNTLYLQNKFDSEYNKLLDPFAQFVVTNNESDFIDALEKTSNSSRLLEKIFHHYTNFAKIESLNEKISELASIYLKNDYKKRINSVRWAIRINTYYYIEDFRLVYFIPDLSKKLSKQKKWNEESLQLAKTLASLNYVNVIYEIERFNITSPKMYSLLLDRLQEGAITKLIATFNTFQSDSFKIALIKWIGDYAKYEYASLLEENLTCNNSEIRIQSLKSIVKLSAFNKPELIAPFLQSDNWVEKMFAIKVVGTFTISHYKRILQELLSDRTWQIRNAAGEALSKFPDGEILLSYLEQENEDLYAKEMARKWLNSIERKSFK